MNCVKSCTVLLNKIGPPDADPSSENRVGTVSLSRQRCASARCCFSHVWGRDESKLADLRRDRSPVSTRVSSAVQSHLGRRLALDCLGSWLTG